MDDKDWTLLVTLKQSSSISEAADKLFVSQPAISKRIHNLENEFHTSLIIRTKKGMEFTHAGEHLCQYAASMLAQLQEIKDILVEIDENRKILRIGAAPMFSQLVLPGILRRFIAMYPNIYPNIKTGLSSKEFEWLKNGEIQLAFIRGDYILEGYSCYVIGSEPLCVISKNPLNIADLPNYPCIAYDTDASLEHQINDWVHNYFPQQKLHISMRVGDSQTCIHMVSQGAGYAIVPYHVLPEQGLQSLCVNFLRDSYGQIVMRATNLLYNQNEYKKLEHIKLFVDFIMQVFPKTDIEFCLQSHHSKYKS